VTGIRELGYASAMSAAPEHVWVSVVGGRTQLDVALPMDVPVASLVPELVKLVRSRDDDASSDTPWEATRDTFWVLSRLDPVATLQPNETLRGAGVVDGQLLQLTEERALSAPTLYDDVVDAAARLNKAAYAGWNAVSARGMSFVGFAIASLVWVYFLADVTAGAQRAIVIGLAAIVVAAMVGVATLAHRSYGQADVGAAVGWCAIPIGAAIVWALVRGFGDYGVAVGCVVLVLVNAACYRAIGTGRWGYLASGVFFAWAGLAMFGRALGASAHTVGVASGVVGVLACLTVSRLTGSLARVELSRGRSDADQEAVMYETPFTPQPPAIDSGATIPSTPPFGAMPTAEAVWAQARVAVLTRSALYAGLAVSVLCGVATVLRAEANVHWAALVFVGVCAAALSAHARVPASVSERVSLAVPAVALVVLGCLNAQNGTAAMAWAGFGASLGAAVGASAFGLRLAGGNQPHRWASARIYVSYLQYAAYAALIPVTLWVAGVYAEFR
jgi:type VII secretion integral membrane protein EccD